MLHFFANPIHEGILNRHVANLLSQKVFCLAGFSWGVYVFHPTPLVDVPQALQGHIVCQTFVCQQFGSAGY